MKEPALVTAFTTQGEIDVTAHLGNVGVAVDSGAQGVLIGGSTGEGPYLEPGERSTLLRSTRDAFTDLTIICGVFAESTRQAGQQIGEATDAEADAVLVVTPTTLIRGRRHWVVDYYEALADSTTLPIFLYTVPAVTHYELPRESVAELAGHHNIVGMKDSGGDTSRLDALRAIIDAAFVVYAGKSSALTESVANGAYGAITASANYAFDTVSRAVEGDQNAQERLIDLTSVIEPYGVPGTKFAASLAGMDPGPARMPLPSLTNEAKTEIERAILS